MTGACCPCPREEPSPEARGVSAGGGRTVSSAGRTTRDLPHQTSALSLEHKLNEKLKGLIPEVEAWPGLPTEHTSEKRPVLKRFRHNAALTGSFT